MASAYFPPRAEREVLGFVLDDFPFPLALTYARLQEELDRQAPVGAAWAVRDAFECLVRFCACLAVADELAARPAPAEAAELVGLLLKPTGLALGDWHSLLELGLKPLVPLARDGRLAESGRRLPELYGVFFEPNGRRSALNRAIDGQPESFVAWRNRFFGHGVFKADDRAWYASEALRWLGTLHDLYRALRPVLEGWALVAVTPGNEEVLWQGWDQLPPVARHQHAPSGEPLPMELRRGSEVGGRGSGVGGRGSDGGVLALGPLLSVQTCGVCGQPAAFFFDRHRYEREKDRHRTSFLEYFRGHQAERRDWDEARRLAALLPPTFEWERHAHEREEVDRPAEIVFREFEQEYLRPDYLLDAIWRIVDGQPKGYLRLVGPGGVGKTYAVSGLQGEARKRDAVVLAYHVLPGARTDYQVFVDELHAQARELASTVQPQLKASTAPELQLEFATYLAALKRVGKVERLVVAIDGLDELPDPDPRTPGLTQLLPPPEALPDGCFILLASRETLRRSVKADLDQLARAHPFTPHPSPCTLLTLSPDAPANQDLLRAYLRQRLPTPFRAPEQVETALARSGGVFLYAFHLARALEAGAFEAVADLPEGERFYPAYLARLREQAGEALYETVYLPILLLLAAARQPVTLAQLQRWGVPGERLRFALLELRDFLREQRGRLWHDSLSDQPGEHRYEPAHEAFRSFVETDPELSARLREAHATIARVALTAHGEDWEAVDPTDDAELYDLRFYLDHGIARLADGDERGVELGQSYHSACLSAGVAASGKARHQIALDLYGQAEAVLRYLVEGQGRRELANDLAMALNNLGTALADLGRLEAAVAAYEEAITLYRELVERQGRRELANDLATALNNLGNALRAQGRLEAAVAAYDEAIGTYRELVERQGRRELANDLAMALNNLGNALGALGRLEAAGAAYEAAIGTYRELVERQGRRELADDLAMALNNLGNALCLLGRLEAALAAYEEAISIRRELVERQGRRELANDLAMSLNNLGNALRALGRLEAAVGAYDEAIAIRRELVERQGHRELANNLAMGLSNLGLALADLGRLQAAVATHEEAIALFRELVERRGRAELANDLAMGLTNLGNALADQGRLEAAVAAYEEAIGIYRELVEQQGRRELANDLASALNNLGGALQLLGRLEQAVAAYEEAIGTYRDLVERQGRRELANNLAMALMNLGLLREAMQAWQEALDCYVEAIGLWEPLVEAGMGHLVPNFVKVLGIRFNLFRRVAAWEHAANDVAAALYYLAPLLESDSPPQTVVQAFDTFVARLRALSPEERVQLYAALGENAEAVRSLVEGGAE